MKKYFSFSVILLFFSSIINAQNFGFENWSSTNTFVPITGVSNCYPYLINNSESLQNNGGVIGSNTILPDWSALSFSIMRTTDAYTGSYAAIVHMWYNGAKGILAFGNSSNVQQQIPKVQLSSKLHGVSGYYKYRRDNLSTNDTINKGVYLHINTYKNDVNGQLITLTQDTLKYKPTTNYTYFSLPITYLDANVIPDSVSVWFESRNNNSGTTVCDVSHFLSLDDIEFHYTPLSIPKNTIQSAFKVFPNPTSSTIHLTYEKNIQIETLQLIDVTGKVVKNFNTFNQELDVSDLEKGYYILLVKTKEGLFNEKILIN